MKQKLRLLMMTLLCAVVSSAWGADKWVKTAPSSLQTGDIVVIVDQTSSRAMSNNNGTESAPSATSVTLNDDKSEISSEVNANIQWEVTVSNNSYQFGVANTSNYLYCTATNNGVRVGANENNLFTWEIADANNSEYYLHNSATSRYIGVYNSQDWRCYTSVNNNIKNTLTALYKKTSSQGPTAPNISISSETVEVGKTINIIVPSDLTSVEYESDDPSIASVDEDGEITGNSVGSAEITVTWAAVNGVYNAGEKTFSITVTAPVVATVYEEVTNTNQLVAGNEYILVATENSVAMGAPNAGNNKIRDKVDVIIKNNQVSITNQEVTKLTLGGVSGAWTFYASDTENYLALNGNSNEVHSAAEVNDNSKWTITSDFQLCNTSQADTRYIMYNSSNPRFACYKSGQKKAVLFVKEGSSTSTEPSITVNTTSIDIPAAETEGTIGVTFTNVDPELAEIVFYEADGTTETTCDWIAAEINGNNIEYLVDENEGEARIAYFKVHGLDNDENDVYSELITITQAAPVAPGEDYATLPFEFDGGKADIEGTSGLIQEGLDSDYKNSPYLKFDGTGDYVILKFNERPGKLTFDIQGNSFSGGTFTVQTSKDGVTYTDLENYTDLSSTQSEEFNNLGENVRYIKWIYTTKVSGNVALGNIKLAKYEVPQPYTVTITPNDNAEIFVFYNDPDNWPEIQSGDEVLAGSEVMVSTSASEGYQIESVTVTDENEQEIELTEAEEGISWTFTMPSSDVTVTCTVSEIPEPSDEEWVLTDLADLTKDDIFVIVGDNGNTYAMSNDNDTRTAPSAIAVTISDDKITSTVADNIKWNLSSDDDGYIFYPNGETEKWIYCNNTNNGVRMGTGSAKHFTLSAAGYLTTTETEKQRYIGIYSSSDWRCYDNINANIKDQTFGFYKLVKPEPQDEPFTFTISDRATDGETCYATIADLGAGYFKVEGNVEVSTVVINENKQLSYPITFKENDVLPGQGAYLVKGAAGEYTFPTAEEGDVPDIGENMLISTGEGDVSADDMLAIAKAATNHEGDFKFYKLSLNGKGEAGSVGFYWGAAKGAKFNYTKAHQAFLAVPQTGESIESGDDVAAYLFDGDKTGIYNVMATESDSSDDTYTLSGIRVENKQLPKGIYIKNGKKVVVR